jgi:hypothetical protein
MVEAELPDGDIGQITQAIQNALRPSSTVQRIASVPEAKTIVPPAVEREVQTFEAAESIDGDESPPPATKPLRARKPPTAPTVLHLDLTTQPSLEEFTQRANPKNHYERFLVVAAWFKSSRDTNAITVAHVYTCYRALKWQANISDFGQPLRDLKRKQYFTSPEKGHYEINHLGISEVEKLQSGRP